MEEIWNHHEELQTLISESANTYDNDLEVACEWREEFSEMTREHAERLKADLVEVKGGLDAAAIPLHKRFSVMTDIVYSQLSAGTLAVDLLMQYMAKNVTKQELAKQFLSTANQTKRNTLLEKIDEMEIMLQRFGQEEVDLIQKLLQKSYLKLRYSKPVIMNESSVHRLDLVRKAMSAEGFSDRAREGHLRSIISEIPALIRDGALMDVRNAVMSPLKRIPDQIKMLEDNFEEYQDSIKVDSQFYM